MRIAEITQIDNLIPKRFIQRSLFGPIFQDINRKEIQIIYGPRQVGKSSLLYLIMKKIFSKDTDMLYFNLDLQDEIFASAELFISDVNSRKKTKGPTYIFIDEIQRQKDIGLFLKYIYDKNLGFKFIVTGSSSLSIQNIINEPLTGRKFEYFLSPVSIFEILDFQGIDVKKLDRNTPQATRVIDDYLLYGGYPEVVLETAGEDKFRKLSEISKSYITRDLKDVFGITDTAGLESTAIYLSQNIGNILSRENIAKILSLTVHKVNAYLEALEKSFVIGLLRPFFKNPVNELSHRPKTYFLDNGIRNVLIQKTHPRLITGDYGKLFEQTVWQILVNMHPGQIKYWRNINQTEVDFILEKTGKLSVFETKYSYENIRLPKNLSSFINIYSDIISDSKVITKDNFIPSLTQFQAAA